MHIVGIGGVAGLSLLLGGLRDLACRFDSFPDEVTATAILCQGQLTRAGLLPRSMLCPGETPAGAGVAEAIAVADAVVLGPGGLYSGVIANLLVAGVAEAIRQFRGVKVYVCSLLEGDSEAGSLSAAGQLKALEDWLGWLPVNVCLLNSGATGRSLAALHARSEEAEVARLGVIPVPADLLSGEGSDVRLDPVKLALSVVALAHGALRAREVGIR